MWIPCSLQSLWLTIFSTLIKLHFVSLSIKLIGQLLSQNHLSLMTTIYFAYASDSQKLPDFISPDWGDNLQFVCACKCPPAGQSQTLMSLNTTSRLQRMANNVDPSKFQVLIRKNPPIYLNILAQRDQSVWLLWEPRTLSEDGLSGSFMFSGHWPLSGLGRLGQRWIMEISGDKLRPAPSLSGMRAWRSEMIRRNEWTDHSLEHGWRVWWLVASQEFSRKRNTWIFLDLQRKLKIEVKGAAHSHPLLSKSWLPGSQR